MLYQTFTTIKSNPIKSLLWILPVLVIAFTSCKGKKEVVEPTTDQSNTAEAAQIAKAKAALQALLNEPPATSFPILEDKERRLAEVKAMGIRDAEVFALIKQVEAKLAKERADLEAAEAAKRNERTAYDQLNSAFSGIAGSGNPNIANAKIDETLRMFTSPEAPVLLVFYQENGNKDYDRPTTIAKYLNYLKDQGKNPNRVDKIIYDTNGKIKELELVKN